MEIKLIYHKKGKCKFCTEPATLYKAKHKGKIVGICKNCFYEYLDWKYPKKEIHQKAKEVKIGKNIIIII